MQEMKNLWFFVFCFFKAQAKKNKYGRLGKKEGIYSNALLHEPTQPSYIWKRSTVGKGGGEAQDLSQESGSVFQ